MSDGLDAFWAELALRVTPAEGVVLLRMIDCPMSRVPSDSLSPREFWYDVRRALDAGVLVRGTESLVRMVAAEYPGNAVFRAAAEAPAAAARAPGGPPPEGPQGRAAPGGGPGRFPALVLICNYRHDRFLPAVRQYLDPTAELFFTSVSPDTGMAHIAVRLTREVPEDQVAALRRRLVAEGLPPDLEISQQVYDHRPHLLETLLVNGPEQPYVLEGVPSTTPVRDIATAILGAQENDGTRDRTGRLRRTVVDHLQPDGGFQRLDPGDTLFGAGVRDGDTLSVFPAAVAGGPAPVPRFGPPSPSDVPVDATAEQPTQDWVIEAHLPSTAQLDREIGLTVVLRPPAGGPARDSSTGSLNVSPREIRLTLSVVLPPGMSAPDGMEAELRFRTGHENRRPAETRIPLRVHGPGRHDVRVSAWSSGTYLGTLAFSVVGTRAPGSAQTVTERLPVASFAPDLGQVTLQVFAVPGPVANLFQFQLLSEAGTPEQPVYLQLAEDPWRLMDQLRDDLRTLAVQATDRGRKEAFKNLRALAIELWEQLIPPAVQEQFWAARGTMGSFSVAATGQAEHVPWELLYPLDPSGQDGFGFLADEVAFSRHYFSSRRPSGQIVVDRPAFVMAGGPRSPRNAHLELEGVLAALGPVSERPSVLSTVDEVRDWLRHGSGGVLHSACHTSAHDGQHFAIPLRDADFRQMHLAEAAKWEWLAERNPLVFVNACDSARVTKGLTQLNGWAGRFMKAGARNFVGTQWAVDSGTARAFAEAFYAEFAAGQVPIGRALHRARLQLRESGEHDVSRLAYALYGSPWAYAVRRG